LEYQVRPLIREETILGSIPKRCALKERENSMNGFELKEKIELTKKRIKEVEMDIQRASTIEYGKSEDVQYEKVEKISVVELFENKTKLNSELAFLEKSQEMFNVQTMLKFETQTLSLSEIIKLYGMKAKQISELEVIISSRYGLPAYNRSITKDSLMIPYLKAKETEQELKNVKHSFEEQLSVLKSLIATGNSKTIANL
jgi:hypothetical protein